MKSYKYCKYLLTGSFLALLMTSFFSHRKLLENSKYKRNKSDVKNNVGVSDASDEVNKTRNVSYNEHNEGALIVSDFESSAESVVMSEDSDEDYGYRSEVTEHHTKKIKKIIFNRVYKTGSSVIRTVIAKLRRLNRFNDKKSNIYGLPKLTERLQQAFCRNMSRLPSPVIYDRHVFFVDCSKFGLPTYPHINTVRDPVSRALSLFAFRKYGFQKNDITEIPAGYNMTIDECVSKRSYACVPTFQQIAFFCGQDSFCQYPSSPLEENRAVAQAKRNAEKHFVVIGIYEKLTAFFQVLERLLPQFFKSSPDVYKRQSTDLLRRYATKQKEPLSESSLSILKEAFKKDYDFYYFIKQRFDVKATHILKNYV